MLPQIGLLFPFAIGYNLYRYTIFRCRLIGKTCAGARGLVKPA
ncbi:hypothetical protein BH160DRAFT_1485 [Burkholderia sp. H160]|nr:hypothetical protein BH160DRAFT_1485 [Burkholderia sp. H160]